MFLRQDENYMRHALTLARRGLGCVWPNPAVGCVIVRDGVIVGRGWTQPGGRPHAEPEALVQAGELARGADVYVTLEPCAHQGQTPPCARALIDAGVARVVVACGDPDERVSGRGVAMLREAGIEVVEGVCSEEAQALNAGFILRVEQGRPFVTLKTATSLDGKVALRNGESKWITGELARRHVHLERSKHDAVLVGIETVLRDDPALTTRLDGYDHVPVRVVLDSDLRFPMDAKMLQGASRDPLWIVCKKGNYSSDLEEVGAVIVSVKDMEIEMILHALAERGVTRLFVEGGAQVHTSFVRSGLYDQMLCYRAAKVMGDDARGAFSALDMIAMRDIYSMERQKTLSLGEDLLEIYRVKA